MMSSLAFISLFKSNRSSVVLCRNFLPDDLAKCVFKDLLADSRDYESEKRMTPEGDIVLSPRLTRSFGDYGLTYKYSGITRETHRWVPALEKLKSRIQPLCSHGINFAVTNVYRSPEDS